jgi:hypothetical protein
MVLLQNTSAFSFVVHRDTSNHMQFYAANAASTIILSVLTTLTFLAASGWKHVPASWNLARRRDDGKLRRAWNSEQLSAMKFSRRAFTLGNTASFVCNPCEPDQQHRPDLNDIPGHKKHSQDYRGRRAR